MTTPDASVRPPLRFDTLIFHRGLRRAMKSSVAIARKRASAPPAVIITGPSGSGKTHVLQAIARLTVPERRILECEWHV